MGCSGKDNLVTKELQKKYMDRKKNEIIDIEVALLKGDFNIVENFGHKLKGNGMSYGYDILTELGSFLEESAKEKDLDKTQVLFKRIKDFINQQP